MVSRADRDALAEVLRKYLSEEITAFELDERLSDIRERTQDEAVDHVADAPPRLSVSVVRCGDA